VAFEAILPHTPPSTRNIRDCVVSSGKNSGQIEPKILCEVGMKTKQAMQKNAKKMPNNKNRSPIP
jgi:hypothetical protein